MNAIMKTLGISFTASSGSRATAQSSLEQKIEGVSNPVIVANQITNKITQAKSFTELKDIYKGENFWSLVNDGSEEALKALEWKIENEEIPYKQPYHPIEICSELLRQHKDSDLTLVDKIIEKTAKKISSAVEQQAFNEQMNIVRAQIKAPPTIPFKERPWKDLVEYLKTVSDGNAMDALFDKAKELSPDQQLDICKKFLKAKTRLDVVKKIGAHLTSPVKKNILMDCIKKTYPDFETNYIVADVLMTIKGSIPHRA